MAQDWLGTSALGVLMLIGASAFHPAQANEATRETIEGLRELTGPALRTVLRFELGGIVTAPRLGGRVALGIEIAPRPDFWYGIGVASTGESVVETTTKVTNDGVTTTQTTHWSSTAVTLSARVFKRLGVAVVSAGLIDNRVGAGVELRGWNDRARLEMLLSEWSRDQPIAVPTLRIGASLQWRGFFAQGGVQDVLVRDQVAAYLGVGVRWDDPDFKSVLPWFGRL